MDEYVRNMIDDLAYVSAQFSDSVADLRGASGDSGTVLVDVLEVDVFPESHVVEDGIVGRIVTLNGIHAGGQWSQLIVDLLGVHVDVRGANSYGRKRRGHRDIGVRRIVKLRELFDDLLTC